MKKPDTQKVEVDMVPLIDVISLLLMFLLVVGDSSAMTQSVKMKLPVANAAQKEDAWPGEGRIVIQMKAVNGAQHAVFNNTEHAAVNGVSGSLKEHLLRYIDDEIQHGRAKKRDDQTLNIPVKLRIPADCPMPDAEKVLKTIADVGLTEVLYAAVASER